MTLYHYRSADGVWRDRCAKHTKRTGPYRAVTVPVASRCTICVECHPWGNAAPAPTEDHHANQLEQLDDPITE